MQVRSGWCQCCGRCPLFASKCSFWIAHVTSIRHAKASCRCKFPSMTSIQGQSGRVGRKQLVFVVFDWQPVKTLILLPNIWQDTVIVLIAAHAPSTHLSYFEVTKYHLSLLWLAWKWPKSSIFGSIIATDIETNKHPPKTIYLSALGTYWNEYGNRLNRIFWDLRKLNFCAKYTFLYKYTSEENCYLTYFLILSIF